MPALQKRNEGEELCSSNREVTESHPSPRPGMQWCLTFFSGHVAKTLKNESCQDVFLFSEELWTERRYLSVQLEGFVSRSQLGCGVEPQELSYQLLQRLHCAPGWAQWQLGDFVVSWLPLWKVPLVLWGVHIHVLLLGYFQVCQEWQQLRGKGLCNHSRAGHWEHRDVTPDFTGAGEQTERHLLVHSPPCKSVPIENKLDPLWLQNELCHPNQRLKQSKQIL